MWIQILVYAFAHPAVAIASHTIVIANLSELVTMLSPNEHLSHAHNLACVIAVTVDTVAYIIAYLIFYHLSAP
jgi:hypothetical protein